MNIKRWVVVFLLSISMMMSIPAVIDAATESPTFKGVKIHWEHGRKHFFYSYSNVQTGKFMHSATANAIFSGWKRPGTSAYAQQYVGFKKAVAYWNCR
ncbi:hypothetical protein [Staphylococcus lutrae]|uniref:Lactococcin 972 family bacteriocin n=1 Tax=Staphylococcus lutrae TaxID=155085 RepID=A0AAC9RTY1_9STAP|nr:hypothetical protein [Staphylococcus lutrae]ARJ51114.1 hypothetical protein B5P37_07255 [Staphylococcus lutrae]PNZ34827.1 hypothetical protein CD134_10040 [Staphylococcus lutrae]